jgi:hypothetical protein
VSVVALSSDGGALYRGELDASTAVGPLVVTLYADAAK